MLKPTKKNQMAQKLKSMKISEVMIRPVVCTSPDTSAHDILEKLNSCQYSGIPVVEDNILIGMVSERDILELFIQGKNLKCTFARDFMIQNVITAEQDSLILPVIKTVIDNQILRLPITHQGKLVGIVTRHDLLKYILDTTPEFALIT